jgi:pimeloyl-ACP methyl ester carboxylesterase
MGLAGFSAGGAIALVAAADPRIASRIGWLNAFGAFGDAETLLVESATRRIVVDEEERPWKIGDLARRTFVAVIVRLAATEADGERIRERVEPLILGDGPTPSSFDPAFAATLAGDSLAAYRLATASDRQVAADAVAALSPEKHAQLRGVSPNRVAAGLRAPVYLLHDESDTAVPFSQLVPLAHSIPPELLKRVSRFRFFDHVQPGASIGPDAIGEILKLQAHLADVLNVAL